MSELNINEICFNETGVDIDLIPETPAYLTAFGIITLLFSALYFPFCVVIFFYFRSKPGKKYINLKKRNGFLVAFYNVGLMGISVLYGAINAVGNENFPCTYIFTIGIGCFVITVDTYICRVLSFYFRVRFNQKLIKYKFEEIHAKTRVESTMNTLVEIPYIGVDENEHELEVGTQGINFLNEEIKREDEEEKQANELVQGKDKSIAKINFKKSLDKDFTFAIFDDTSSSVGVKTGDGKLKQTGGNSLTNVILKIFCWKHNKIVPKNLQFAFFLTSHRFITTLLIILMGLSLTVGIINIHSTRISFNEVNLNCVGCAPSAEQQETSDFLFFSGALMIICIIFSFLLRKYPDGLGVKEEIYVFAILLIFSNLLFVVIPRFFLFSQVEIDRKFDFSLLSVINYALSGFHSTIYQVWRIHRKESHEKLTLESSIEKILSTPQGTKAFAMFLSTNIAIEHLIFYKTVDKWESMFNVMSETRRVRIANDILEMFLTRKRKMEVNLSGAMMLELRTRILQNDLSQDMFVKAKNEALTLMDDVFYDFTKSYYYQSIHNGFIALEPADR